MSNINETMSGRPTAVSEDRKDGWIGLDGKKYYDNMAYTVSSDGASTVIKALSPVDPVESPVRKYTREQYKDSRPTLLDHFVGESDEMGGPVFPTSKVGCIYIQPHDVSTVLSACYKMAEGKGLRNKLRTPRVRKNAREVADELGFRVFREFNHHSEAIV